MATAGTGLDRPPAQPDELKNQGIGSDLSAVTQKLGERVSQGQQPPQTNQPPSPAGDIVVQGEAVRRVVEQMNMNKAFAPYGERILALLKAGLGEASGTPSTLQPDQAGAVAPAPQQTVAPAAGPKDAEGGKGFPG